jgi:hypothetical protein
LADETSPVFDEMRTASNINDTDLGNFLSRPVLIHQLEWAINSNPYVTIYPWDLFLNNPRVQNRINNFTLLRGTLKLKVTINGNSFYYGRLMISYNPLQIYDAFYKNTSDWYDSVRLSQRPHIMVDPALNIAGVLEAPFMWPYDYFDVPYVVTAAQSLGSLSIRTLCDLEQANDTTTTIPATVSIFAWMENVELAGVTNTNIIGLSPQSGDEYGGTVSGALNTASQFFSPIATAGWFSPYARATEIVLKVSSNIAKALGFSRPCDIEESKKVKPLPVGTLAVTEGPDLSAKLTLDPKQELSIDPSVWGSMSGDDMSIINIAKTRTLMRRYAWATNFARGDRIFNFMVDPCIVPASNDVYLSAVGAMTLPFQYWSGNLKFTLEVVASQFHKGRLAIVYDCFETPATLELNTNYVQILDITEQRRITFDIGNMQSTAIRNHYWPGKHSALSPITTTRLEKANIDSICEPNTGNGTISVWVVNTLTSPVTGDQSVDILMYMEAGDDYRVYAPSDMLDLYQTVVPESGIDSGTQNPVTMDPQVYSLSIRPQQPSVAKVYCGEHIHSIRALMKRYCRYMCLDTDNVRSLSLESLWYFRHPIYPLNPLEGPGVKFHDATGGTDNINYVHQTYVSYFRTMFCVMRGSCRYKAVPLVPYREGLMNPAAIHVSRLTTMDDALVAPSQFTRYTMDFGNKNTIAYSYLACDDGTVGSSLTVSNTNSCLEFEVPFYKDARFTVASSGDGSSNLEDFAGGFQINGTSTSLPRVLELWTSAGEDFTFGYFYGQPELVYTPNIPLPN